MGKNIIVKLGGTDVTAFLRKMTKTTTYGDALATMELEFSKNVNDLVTISNALTVEAWMDGNDPPTTKIFNGYLDNFQPEAGKIKCTAKDTLAALTNKDVTQVYDKSVVSDPSYPDGKISAIFKDIVETYGGLSTNGGATVQDSGVDITLARFVCNHADPFERCKKLAETLSWVFYYRADTGYVYFEPKNYVTNANILRVGTNIIEVPDWEYDRSELINDLTVDGAKQLVQTSEYFTGDGAETHFTLSYIPEDIAVYYSAAKNYGTTALLASETKVVDVSNSISSHDVEVDRKQKKITTTSFVPAASTNNLLVQYSYYAPIPVHMTNPASIVTYGTAAKTVNLTDIITLEDAWKRAETILAKYSDPFKSTRLKVLWNSTMNLSIGQNIRVVDSINVPNVDQYFTIYQIKEIYPDMITEINVGDKQYTIQEYQANVLERVKRLEEATIGGVGAVSEIISNENDFGLVPESTTILTEIVNDSFILSHPINGVMYGAGETAILENFETTLFWNKTGITQTLTNDSTAGHFWVGTQGVNSAWVATTGDAFINKTIAAPIDIHLITGQNSGGPTQGTAGVWVWCANGAAVSQVILNLGSTSGNYCSFLGQTYSQRNGITPGFTLVNGLNYVLFDLNSVYVTIGNPNWTAMQFVQMGFTVTAASNLTFDYLTASKSNDIGLNGLGSRITTSNSITYTW